MGGIPISEIKAYADFNGITGPVQRECFLRVMQAMDQAELKEHGKTKPRT